MAVANARYVRVDSGLFSQHLEDKAGLLVSPIALQHKERLKSKADLACEVVIMKCRALSDRSVPTAVPIDSFYAGSNADIRPSIMIYYLTPCGQSAG